MSTVDISDTLAPNSDQLDAVDLLPGPRTFTITGASRGSSEQPVNIALAEFDRPWRPGKSMRRVLVAAWGADASTYTGRRVTLFCDPRVRFGGTEVGGIRISHMSDIDKTLSIPLLVSRGKSAVYKVEPLTDEPPTADRTQKAVAAFAKGGVTVGQLEKHIGRSRDKWTDADVDTLNALFQSLKAGEVTKEQAFGDDAGANTQWDQAAPE